MTTREESRQQPQTPPRVHPEKRPDHLLPPPETAKPQKKKKGGVWLWLIVLAGLGLAGWYSYQHFYLEPQQAKAAASKKVDRPVPVVADAAKTGDYPIYLEVDGTVQPNNSVTVHSRVDGQLLHVFFTEGQFVKKGDKLAQIDDAPFQVMLQQAQGQLAKDQATLENAKADVDRYEKASEAVPQQQLDTARATYAQTLGAIATDNGQINAAKVNIAYCNITAPISGIVGLRKVDEGNIIHATDVNGLVVINQVQPIALDYYLTQDDLEQVQKAMKNDPKVEVDAYDKNIERKIATGYIAALDNQIDPGTDTFEIKALFDNTDNSLYPSEFVNTKTLVETRRGVVLVPSPAVQTSPQGSFVYVVKEDNTVEMRPVVLGPQGKLVTVIDRGVSAGEMVVTDGLDKLADGKSVTVRTQQEVDEAAASQSGSQPSTHAATGPSTQRHRRPKQ